MKRHISRKQHAQKHAPFQPAKKPPVFSFVPPGQKIQNQDLYQINGTEPLQLSPMPQINTDGVPRNTDIGDGQTAFPYHVHQRVEYNGEHMIMGVTVDSEPPSLFQIREQGGYLGADFLPQGRPVFSSVRQEGMQQQRPEGSAKRSVRVC